MTAETYAVDRVAIIDGPDWWGSMLVTRAGSPVTPSTVRARSDEALTEARAVGDLIAGFAPTCLVASLGSAGAPEQAMYAAGANERPTLAISGIEGNRTGLLAAAVHGLSGAGLRCRVFLFDVDPDPPRKARWEALGFRVDVLGPWEPPAEPDPETDESPGS